jgi:hypothetical protein
MFAVVEKGEKKLAVYSQLDLDHMLKHGFTVVNLAQPQPAPEVIAEDPKPKRGRPAKAKD